MSSMRSLALALASLMVLAVVLPPTADALQLEGSIAQAQTDVAVRDTIPVGLLHNSQVIGQVARGAQVIVYEVKDIPTLVRTDQWLRVRVRDSGVTGWVYNGSSDSGPNFVAVGLAG